MLIGLALAASLTLVSGVAHGFLDGRWAQQSDLKSFGNGLGELPESVGDWDLVEQSELADNARRLLRCHGSLVREYQNSNTGDRVSIALLFGPRGPIAVHTPEVCYSSVGTKPDGPRLARTVAIDGVDHTFWKTKFMREPNPEPVFEVWYGWSDGGKWFASEHPRFWMTENLFKIQLSGPASEFDSNSACRDFLTAFLPDVQEYLQTL